MIEKQLFVDGKECYLVKCNITRYDETTRQYETVWDDRDDDTVFDGDTLQNGDILDLGFVFCGDAARLDDDDDDNAIHWYRILSKECSSPLDFYGLNLDYESKAFSAYPFHCLVDYQIEITHVVEELEEEEKYL